MQLCKTLNHSPPRILFPKRISQPRPLLHALPGFLRSHPQASSLGCSRSGLRGLKSHLITACIGPCRDAAFHQLELEAEVDEIKGAEMGISMVAPEDASGGDLSEQGLWDQIKEIVKFTGPATGMWVCGPLMSLIDTAVIGQGSSIELAALGPGTVICDYMGYWFMFLSIATSNMIAASLVGQDKNKVQHQISMLLFIGLACGFLMLFFTKFFGSWALTAFVGPKNLHIVPSANTYVQIRGLAWPAVMIGCIAQSASLGMKDSWGPLKALAVATAVNGIGHIVLCSILHYGIAGAAWATMISQVVSAYMMVASLSNKGYNAFPLTLPTSNELFSILGISAPVFITKTSRVAFYALLAYFATLMGTISVAAHQVLIQTYCMGTVWGEPLSQTAQSFMPELIYGTKQSLVKARALLKSLFIIGSILGLVIASTGTLVLWWFPKIFTSDPVVTREIHKVLVPFFIALSITPPTQSLEGTLLAGRDLKFISASLSGCFTLGALLLLLVSSKGLGLTGCWFALSGFQWARFLLALRRLSSPSSILYLEDPCDYKLEKLKST